MLSWRRTLLPVTSLLALCAATQGAPQATSEDQPQSAPQEPNAFVELLDREAEPLKGVRVASEDGRVKTLVAGVVDELEPFDGEYFLQPDIGTETPMECWIYPKGHDLAAWHQRFSEQAFQAIAQHYGEIEARAIERIDAGVFGAHPYLALDWLYRVKTREGALAAGQIKHLAAIKGDASVYCRHNETGYRESFTRVFRGLVESLEVLDTSPEPYYQEVMTVSLATAPTGVATITMTLDEDGNTRIVERMALLILVDQQTIVANDSYNVQFSTPEGLLLDELEVDSVNGEVTSRLRLESSAEEGWKVSGTWSGEEVESSLGGQELMSVLGQRLALSRFLARGRRSGVTKFADWSSDADPKALTEIGVQILGAVMDGVETQFDLGARTMDAVLDENASPRSATISMGSLNMKLTRVFVRGELPSKSPEKP